MGALRDRTARHPVWLAVLAAVLLLTVSVALTAVFKNASTYDTGLWDNQSQELVFGRMLQMQQGQGVPGGFLGAYRLSGGENENRYLFRDNAAPEAAAFEAYPHQSGVQGWALGMLNKALGLRWPGGEARERILYFINSTLFYAATLCLCAFVGRAWGALPALSWLASVLLSPWLQRGMKDLYWCLWLWWLPALAGLALCALTRRRGKTPVWAFVLPFAAVLLRSLCGFEFITVYLVLGEIPLVFCWAQDRAAGRPARPWLGRMAEAGAAGLGGMAAALGVWFVQGRQYFGSWAGSAANMAGIAGSRISLTDGSVNDATVGGVLLRYLVQDENPVLCVSGFDVTLPALGIVCLTALGLTALLLFRRDRAALRDLAPAACVWALSLAAPLSWLVLSKAHSAAHPHIIPMLWQFAFVPVSCALLALLLKTVCRTLRR